MKENFGKIFFTVIAVITYVCYRCTDTKGMVLFLSLFSALMYVNTTLTTLGNAMIGRDIDVNFDVFWKLLFIVGTCVGFTIYFSM